MPEDLSVLNWGLAILGAGFPLGMAILKYGPTIRKNNNQMTEKRCKENRDSLREILETKIDNLSDTVTNLKVTVEKSTEKTQNQITTVQNTMIDILRIVKVD